MSDAPPTDGGQSPLRAQTWIMDAAPAIVSILVVLMFGGMLAAVMLRAAPPGSERLLDTLLGALAGSFITVVTYWIGSTAGSTRKTEMLYHSTPNPVPPP